MGFLAFLYLVGLKIKETLYNLGILRLKTLPCKVISVGNLTAGGTGKTPVVEYVVKFLQSRQRKAAVLTRGYKRENKAALLEVKPESSPLEFGDEAVYLSRETKVPVIVSVNRYKGGLFAMEKHGTEFCILDDGFQRRWSLYRNIELLVIDASNPFGNGSLLPKGILREPVKNVEAADIIMFTKTDDADNLAETKEIISKWNDFAVLVETVYEPKELYNVFAPAEKMALSEITGKKVFALSAIGNPKYFRKVISKLNPAGIGWLSFRDHHTYSNADIKLINEKSFSADVIITTEKDAVKLAALDSSKFGKKLLALKIELKFLSGEKDLQDRINIT